MTATRETQGPKELNGQRLMLMFFDASNDARAPAYIVGTARWDGSELSVDLGEDKPPFLISEDLHRKIRPLLPALETIAEGSKYFLTMSIEVMPPGTDPEQAGYLNTGLKWPD